MLDAPGAIPASLQVSSSPPRKSVGGKIAIAVIFAAAIAAFFYFDLRQYLTLESLKAHRDQLLAYTDAHFVAAVAIFSGLYVLQTTFSLPGGALLSLTGGFLFGSFLGTMIVLVPATLGATLAFLVARYLLRDWVERKFGDRLEAFQRGFAKNAFSYLLTLRLIPLFPFFLVNLVSGLTRIRLGTYVAATALGIIPGTFVFANAGRQLGSINSLNDVASPSVLGAFGLLALFALVPVLYRKFRGKA
jgi:uncharacterized membrane protein YdjX (TVP38/TMEM64 family)